MYISKSLSEVLLNTQYSCFIAYAHTVEPCVWLAFFLCHLITQKKSFPLQFHSSGSKSRVNSQLDNWKPLPHQPESTKHVPKCRHNAQTQLAPKHMDIFFYVPRFSAATNGLDNIQFMTPLLPLLPQRDDNRPSL